jgi:hypothetical protein
MRPPLARPFVGNCSRMKKRSPYADIGAAVAASAGVNEPSRLRKRPKPSAALEAEWFAGVQRQWVADKAPAEAKTATESAETKPNERESTAQRVRGGKARREEEVQGRQDHKRPQVQLPRAIRRGDGRSLW